VKFNIKSVPTMDERSQGAVEYLLVLAAVLVVVAVIVASIFVASRGLGSTIGDQIENARKEVIDGLVGALRLLE
jgi:uncharacterized protein (UPF0333 family)